MLAKNPAGFAAVLADVVPERRDVCGSRSTTQVADGRDPSWLYDVPFERAARDATVDVPGRAGASTWRRASTTRGVDARSSSTTPTALADRGGPGLALIANYTAFAHVAARRARA